LFANAKIIVNGVPVGGADASFKNPSGVTTMNIPFVTGRGVDRTGELNTPEDLEEYGSTGTGVELKIPLLFKENVGFTDENTGMAP